MIDSYILIEHVIHLYIRHYNFLGLVLQAFLYRDLKTGTEASRALELCLEADLSLARDKWSLQGCHVSIIMCPKFLTTPDTKL